VLLLLGGCVSVESVRTGQALVVRDRLYVPPVRQKSEEPVKTYDVYWLVDPNKPVTRIEVWLKEQVMIVFQGDLAAALLEVSSGKHDFETPVGRYRILSKDEKHFSSTYGEIVNGEGKIINYNADLSTPVPKGCRYEPSAMPYFMRLTDKGVGFHTGYLPGYAASHGCIRLKDDAAKRLFSVTKVGTPVNIIP
jgi:lipoprotein-anchoring transpeptidase ErfK/SrfK